MPGYPSKDKPWMKYYFQGTASYKLPTTDCSMYTFLRSCSENRLDAAALDYYGNKISYRKMFANIDAIASALLAVGVRQGDTVSVCPLNTPEFVYLLYAINKVGAISNWLSPTSTVDDIRTQLKSTGSKLLFVVEMAAEKLVAAAEGTEVSKVISVPLYCSMPAALRFLMKMKSKGTTAAEPWKIFIAQARKYLAEAASVFGSETAVIEYTGGSTGVPKGVMLTNENMNSYYISFHGANSAGLSDYQPGGGFLACVPLFLGFGVSSCCHGPLCHGMYLVLAPDPSPDGIGKVVLNRKPNYIVVGRVQIDGIVSAVKNTKTDLSFIHSVMYGGEAANKPWAELTEKLLRAHGSKSRVLNGYGMTETAAAILIESASSAEGLVPLAGVNVKITDPDTGEELPYDVIGELCLSAQAVMKGYYRQELSGESPITEEGAERWLRTGDLAKITEDGTIHIVGRIKRIYHKIASGIGVRVYPVRIEETLAKYETVEKCAVIGVKDEKTAYRTIAYIKLKDGCTDSSPVVAAINKHCRELLPESHVPDQYIFCTEFPLTRSGKINYMALESEYEKNSVL